MCFLSTVQVLTHIQPTVTKLARVNKHSFRKRLKILFSAKCRGNISLTIVFDYVYVHVYIYIYKGYENVAKLQSPVQHNARHKSSHCDKRKRVCTTNSQLQITQWIIKNKTCSESQKHISTTCKSEIKKKKKNAAGIIAQLSTVMKWFQSEVA